MKNTNLYEKRAIEGWPCFYFTVEAVDKHNSHLKKLCNELPEGVNDFSFCQKIRRFFYICFFLLCYDSVIALKDSITALKHKGDKHSNV